MHAAGQLPTVQAQTRCWSAASWLAPLPSTSLNTHALQATWQAPCPAPLPGPHTERQERAAEADGKGHEILVCKAAVGQPACGQAGGQHYAASVEEGRAEGTSSIGAAFSHVDEDSKRVQGGAQATASARLPSSCIHGKQQPPARTRPPPPTHDTGRCWLLHRRPPAPQSQGCPAGAPWACRRTPAWRWEGWERAGVAET